MEATINAEPRMKVRLVDRGNTRYYTGVRIVVVELPLICGECGGPRGKPYSWRFCEDGEWYMCDRWNNPCGHIETYHSILYGDTPLRD